MAAMSFITGFLLFAEYPNLSLPQVRRPSLRGQYLRNNCLIFISKSGSPLTPEAGVLSVKVLSLTLGVWW